MDKRGFTSFNVGLPHIPISFYDHTNEWVSNNVHEGDNGVYRCYGSWFGHDWKVSTDTATEVQDLDKAKVCIRIISDHIVYITSL